MREVSKAGQRVGARMKQSQKRVHETDVQRPQGGELGKEDEVVE